MGNLTPTIGTTATGATTAVVSSATYAAGVLIELLVTTDDAGSSPTASITNTGTGQTWVLIGRANSHVSTNGGGAEIWACVSTGFTGTITAHNSFSGGQITVTPVVWASSGNAFNSTAASNFGATTAVDINTASATHTGSVVTTAANSWVTAVDFNFTRTATFTATSPAIVAQQGNDGAGDQYVILFDTSKTVQPSRSSGVTVNMGGTYAATAQGHLVITELLDPGGGGTNYTGNPADPVGITDAAAGQQDNVRSQADAVGVTDAATTTASNARTVADAVGLTDSAVSNADNVRVLADPVGLTDTATAQQGTARTVADPIGMTDAATVVQSQFTAPADLVGLTDTASTALTAARETDDAIGITDTVVVTLGQVVSPADPVGITDAASAVQALARAADDTIGLSDAASATQTNLRQVDDPVGITDSVTATITSSGSAVHIFTTQTPQSQGFDSNITVGVEFDVDGPETVNSLRYYKTALTDPQWVGTTIDMGLWDGSGTLIASGSYTQTGAEPDGWIDVPVTPVSISNGQTYIVGYYVPASSGYAFTAGEFATPIDNPPLHGTSGCFTYATGLTLPATTSTVNWYADVTLAGGATDYTATPADSVGVTDTASAAIDAVREQDDTIGITDTASGSLGYTRQPADPVGVTDQVTTAMAYHVLIADTIGITDTGVQQSIDYGWAQDDAVGITDSVTAVISGTGTDYTANPADPVGLTDAAASALAAARAVVDSVGITDDATRVILAARLVPDPVGIADTVTWSMTRVVIIHDLIGITDGAAGSIPVPGDITVTPGPNLDSDISATASPDYIVIVS